jgi:transketolase
MTTISQLQSLDIQVRRDIVKMAHAIQYGHPGGSHGCADFITALYASIFKQYPANITMESHGEELFFIERLHS